MRILVCGGRDFKDAEWMASVLNEYETAEMITGGAPGADRLASEYAVRRGWKSTMYVAQWRAHGRAAGPIRNQQMLDRGKPDLVIAFPGGRGTADMARRARLAGVPVREVSE